MVAEYKALVQALQNTDIPFAEYGWKTRPEGTYGVVNMDMEAGSLIGDGVKQDRSFEASVDVFFHLLKDEKTIMETVEGCLKDVCGASWDLNSIQHESSTGLFHIEWVCTVLQKAEPEATTEPGTGTATEPGTEPAAGQTTEPGTDPEPGAGDP